MCSVPLVWGPDYLSFYNLLNPSVSGLSKSSFTSGANQKLFFRFSPSGQLVPEVCNTDMVEVRCTRISNQFHIMIPEARR